jgi:hypothetical protein
MKRLREEQAGWYRGREVVPVVSTSSTTADDAAGDAR